MPDTSDELCRCGHAYSGHEHYRVGEDCGLCGRSQCPFFSPARWWHRFYDPWTARRG